MADTQTIKKPRTPPPWFVHGAWRAHRFLYRMSGGRFLWAPTNRRGWGALRLTAIGRTTGQERSVIIGYLMNGDDMIALAMNGGDEGYPSWYLNLMAHPQAQVRVKNAAPITVVAIEATGEDRELMWKRWATVDPSLDARSAVRKTPTPVVILRPVTASA